MYQAHLERAAREVLDRADVTVSGDDSKFAVADVDGPVTITKAQRAAIVKRADEFATLLAIETAKRELAAHMAKVAEGLTEIKPRVEVDGWPNKQAAAFQFEAARRQNPGATVAELRDMVVDMVGRAIIDHEIAETSETWDAIAEKVVRNALAFAAVSGAMAGIHRNVSATLDVLGATATADAIEDVIAVAKADVNARVAAIVSGAA